VEGISCRLLPYADAGGPHNMAADQVLLEMAVAGIASLRFYGWSEATLSLGYFQSERSRHTERLLAGLPFVRRLSGGETLVHHHELTYALGLPAGSPWQGKAEKAADWLGRVHAILARVLKQFGVPAQVAGAQSDQPTRGLLCFHHITPGDLVMDRHKIVGSAQRRQHGALMQHGGILLATSPYTPTLPGIRELTGRNLTGQELWPALAGQWFGKSLTAADWTDSERRRIEDLVDSKYTQAGWNGKR
jgi:lipoate-protein ligase A